MKMLLALFCIQFAVIQHASSQENSNDCWCDTSFNSFQEGTTRNDSVNWSRIKCFYTQKRGKLNPKSVVNYRNGQRHGEYVNYYQKNYWVFVRQRGYQQAVPRRYHKVKDFYRREGKSLFGKAEAGMYNNDQKEGIWYSMDTNQRIVSQTSWENGIRNESGRTCNGLYDIPNMLYRSEFDSIISLVSTLEDGTHDYLLSGNKIISFQTQDHQLNGEFRFYKKGKNQYIYSTQQFLENCLSDSSVTFSMNGDTTRIETDFKRGIPYTIVSFTPSSRGTTYYRAPRNSYELNSDYRNGLIVESRKKENLKN